MKAIYDTIGESYDTTRRADPEIFATLSSLLEVEDDKCYLDVACGTGNYTSALARFRGKWFAFDESEKMLAKARSKCTLANWKHFSAENLDYESNYFDGAVCALAIHHFMVFLRFKTSAQYLN
jgi:ubiquinone/menaquinone biosynthesis C-methylase UbiE